MKSMTGFGKFETVCPADTVITVEISSVNRKQLEVRVNLPPELAGFDTMVRKCAAQYISRGALSVKVSRTKGANSTGTGTLNTALLENLAVQCLQLRAKLGLNRDLDIAQLLTLPGVLDSQQASDCGEEMEQTMQTALHGAFKRFCDMREAEGIALGKDLASRLELLKSLLERIRPFAGSIAENIKNKILEKIYAEKLPVDLNDERLLREILFYADRSDVTEEITRLESHFKQAAGFLAQDNEPVGRSLDFLIQEMFREITTLSNKAGSSEISPLTVAFKTELEKIREQIQNVE